MSASDRLFAVPLVISVLAASAAEATREAQAEIARAVMFNDLEPVEVEPMALIEPCRFMDVFGRKASCLVYAAEHRTRQAARAAKKASRPAPLKGTDVLKLMAEGWELGTHTSKYGTRGVVQNGGVGSGGETRTVSMATVRSFLRRQMIVPVKAKSSHTRIVYAIAKS